MNDKEVYLRALEPNDYLTTVHWRNDSDLWSMVVGRRYYVSSENEKQWILDSLRDNKDNVRVAICLAADHTHVGNAYLLSIDWYSRQAYFSILLGKEYWGHGYATQATSLLLHHAFYDLGLNRVQSRLLTRNSASMRLHEKCGFQQEGVLRQAAFKDGMYQDLALMSILMQDFISTDSRPDQ